MRRKFNLLTKNISLGRVSLRDKAVFAGNLSIMLKSGLTVAESLDILAGQAAGRFEKIIRSMIKSVAAGNSLSSALEKFPSICRNCPMAIRF